jgi:hypothetical protein
LFEKLSGRRIIRLIKQVVQTERLSNIQPVFHFEGASRQRDDADSIAFPGQKSALQGLDQGLRRFLVKVFVVRSHGSQDGENLKVTKF